MSLTMYQASVPVFLRMLRNLDGLLDKAATHCQARKIDPDVLTATRLFPDMFAMSRQVQLATDFAKGAGARLSGGEVPKYEDVEKTIPELKARIAKTVAFLEQLDASRFTGAEDREIVLTTGGQPRTFKGDAYLLNFVLPNFYFHVTTAYNILRHCGVEVGKRDFNGPPPG